MNLEDMISLDGKICLGDGVTYNLGLMNVETLSAIQKKFDINLMEPAVLDKPGDPDAKILVPSGLSRFFNEVLNSDPLTWRFLLWLFLRDNYPSMTETDVGKLMPFHLMNVVCDKVSEQITLSLPGVSDEQKKAMIEGTRAKRKSLMASGTGALSSLLSSEPTTGPSEILESSLSEK